MFAEPILCPATQAIEEIDILIIIYAYITFASLAHRSSYLNAIFQNVGKFDTILLFRSVGCDTVEFYTITTTCAISKFSTNISADTRSPIECQAIFVLSLVSVTRKPQSEGREKESERGKNTGRTAYKYTIHLHECLMQGARCARLSYHYDQRWTASVIMISRYSHT